MNAELKAKWVAALRSGRYKQGTGRLKRRNLLTGEPEYCCIGVLCQVVDPTLLSRADVMTTTAIPPKKVLAAVQNGTVPSWMTLARMNDGGGDGVHRSDFRQIADYIEENY